MKFSKKMYWGPHAAKRKAYILENLRERKFQAAAYVVLPASGNNLLEIHPAAMLLTPGFDSDELEILGIGYGYSDVLECVRQMVDDMRKEGRV